MANDNSRKFKQNQIRFCIQPYLVKMCIRDRHQVSRCTRLFGILSLFSFFFLYFLFYCSQIFAFFCVSLSLWLSIAWSYATVCFIFLQTPFQFLFLQFSKHIMSILYFGGLCMTLMLRRICMGMELHIVNPRNFYKQR